MWKGSRAADSRLIDISKCGLLVSTLVGIHTLLSQVLKGLRKQEEGLFSLVFSQTSHIIRRAVHQQNS